MTTSKKAKEGVCPYCNSDNITYGCLELQDSEVYYPCTCKNCGADFQEWYSLTFQAQVNKYNNEMFLAE